MRRRLINKQKTGQQIINFILGVSLDMLFLIGKMKLSDLLQISAELPALPDVS